MLSKMGTFTSTFSPIEDKSQVEAIILAAVGLSFALASAPMFNSGKKTRTASCYCFGVLTVLDSVENPPLFRRKPEYIRYT